MGEQWEERETVPVKVESGRTTVTEEKDLTERRGTEGKTLTGQTTETLGKPTWKISLTIEMSTSVMEKMSERHQVGKDELLFTHGRS